MAAAHLQQTKAAFDKASFAPMGLDDQWGGLRWFGGRRASGDEITSLVLSHGDDPFDPQQAQVRIEVRHPRADSPFGDQRLDAEAAMLAREQLYRHWEATNTMSDEVRRAGFRPIPGDDPTAPWDDVELTIDGRAVAFRALSHDDGWVAHARHRDVLIGIEARRWPVASTAVVTVDDRLPYEAGATALFGHRLMGPERDD